MFVRPQNKRFYWNEMTGQISVYINIVSLDYGTHDLYWFRDVERCS